MTARWEKGDEHVKLIVEGLNTNVDVFKSTMDINLDGNILIDLTAITSLDKDSVRFLNDFAQKHKAKNYSIIAATAHKIPALKQIEIVPTVTEARDMIFMEITERELGFFGEEE